MTLSTTNLMPVIGLDQISWSPLPCRSKKHTASFRCFLSFGAKSAISGLGVGQSQSAGLKSQKELHPSRQLHFDWHQEVLE